VARPEEPHRPVGGRSVRTPILRTRAKHPTARRSDANVPRTVYRWAQRADNLSLVLLDTGIVSVAWVLAFAAGFESSIPS
jgi:hypothetical protein